MIGINFTSVKDESGSGNEEFQQNSSLIESRGIEVPPQINYLDA